ncbi:hypothetical protein D3C73_1359680 [compost metagenome]
MAKNSAISGCCFWNGVDTPMDSFEGSERVGCGFGLSASVRVFQACASKGGSSSWINLKRPSSGVGDQ